METQQSFCSRLGKAIGARLVVNSGIGGNNTRQGLERLQRDVLAYSPHVVTVMFGLNDSFVEYGKTEPRIPLAEYSANITYFIRELKRRRVDVLLATSNVTANPWENDDLEPYAAEIRKIARLNRLPLVDIHRVSQEMAARGMELWTDRVHPNAFMHSVIFKRFYNRIGG